MTWVGMPCASTYAIASTQLGLSDHPPALCLLSVLTQSHLVGDMPCNAELA